jgi:hypothetical protein
VNQSELKRVVSNIMAKAKKTERDLPEKGRCKIEFLAAKEAIKTQIDEGWPAKTIWSDMAENGTFSGGYRNFVKLVNSVILGITSTRQGELKTHLVGKVAVASEVVATPAQELTDSPKTATQGGTKEPKKISTFEPAKVGGLGAKDANKIQDDLV